ncbi:helix-turn-helix domain-containing protein [Pelotomaculum propionicicum]|uniref:helix-turn-helix domain-containing protein n=1 Tax=Pelotomaculum propionicicum TaxID=258475 RepID=UPI003B7B3849
MSNINEMPEIMTIEEVAKVLRLKRSTAYEYVKQGYIPHIKLGKQIRVLKSKLLVAMSGE